MAPVDDIFKYQISIDRVILFFLNQSWNLKRARSKQLTDLN